MNTVLHPHDVLLPFASDHEALMANLVILAGYILCDAIPVLNELTTKHIEHLYSKKMSTKSEIVSIF